MAAAYRWAPGVRIKANAALVGAELQRLQRETGGTITPPDLVEAARDPQSPLHAAFEWDDARAGDLYRLQQARWLIAGIREVVRQNDTTTLVRVFVNLDDVDDHAQSYVTVARVLSDAQLFAQAKRQFLRDAEAFQRRYEEFVELRGLVAKMRAAAARVKRGQRKRA